MTRLTQRTKQGLVRSDCYTHELLKKLAEYEDLEEQSLLLRLPCRVGDTIYHIWNVDDKLEIQEIKIATLTNLVAHLENGNFGKYIFLTREEAEQKLKKMEVLDE